jgi:hypothetical protein
MTREDLIEAIIAELFSPKVKKWAKRAAIGAAVVGGMVAADRSGLLKSANRVVGGAADRLDRA